MRVARVKFVRILGGTPLLAEVVLEVVPAAQNPGIEFHCTGRGFFSQGHAEDVPEVGYEDWKDGAGIGVAFALRVAGVATALVILRRITGLTSDTNPTAVGAAAALAVWQALEFDPPPEAAAQIEAEVARSRQRPLDALPLFG